MVRAVYPDGTVINVAVDKVIIEHFFNGRTICYVIDENGKKVNVPDTPENNKELHSRIESRDFNIDHDYDVITDAFLDTIQ